MTANAFFFVRSLENKVHLMLIGWCGFRSSGCVIGLLGGCLISDV